MSNISDVFSVTKWSNMLENKVWVKKNLSWSSNLDAGSTYLFKQSLSFREMINLRLILSAYQGSHCWWGNFVIIMQGHNLNILQHWCCNKHPRSAPYMHRINPRFNSRNRFGLQCLWCCRIKALLQQSLATKNATYDFEVVIWRWRQCREWIREEYA